MGAERALCEFSLLVSPPNHYDKSLKALLNAFKQLKPMVGEFRKQKMLKPG